MSSSCRRINRAIRESRCKEENSQPANHTNDTNEKEEKHSKQMSAHAGQNPRYFAKFHARENLNERDFGSLNSGILIGNLAYLNIGCSTQLAFRPRVLAEK